VVGGELVAQDFFSFLVLYNYIIPIRNVVVASSRQFILAKSLFEDEVCTALHALYPNQGTQWKY
jgi:hypothetical protein